jgi:hypothetical protein
VNTRSRVEPPRASLPSGGQPAISAHSSRPSAATSPRASAVEGQRAVQHVAVVRGRERRGERRAERTHLSGRRTTGAQRRQPIVEGIRDQVAVAAVVAEAVEPDQPGVPELAVLLDQRVELVGAGRPVTGQKVQRGALAVVAPPRVVRAAQIAAERARDLPRPEPGHRRAAARGIVRIEGLPAGRSGRTWANIGDPGPHQQSPYKPTRRCDHPGRRDLQRSRGAGVWCERA